MKHAVQKMDGINLLRLSYFTINLLCFPYLTGIASGYYV